MDTVELTCGDCRHINGSCGLCDLDKGEVGLDTVGCEEWADWED
jgi:hypothetical protein